ncbi:MAG: hypothetical protein O2904_04100 [bacterium]|nr:hypothetical protein [bacterium]
MIKKKTFPFTGSFITALVVLAVIDAAFIEKGIFVVPVVDTPNPIARVEPQEVTEQPLQGSTSSNGAVGVQKSSGPDVLETLVRTGFSFTDNKDTTLLSQIIPADIAEVQAHVLMKDNDRVGLLAWTESLQVKVYFIALKEALHSTFSPKMQDLVDETQTREDRPPRNLLTFLDPAISEERIVFVRIRERLYEFHVSKGKDEEIFELIEALTN